MALTPFCGTLCMGQLTSQSGVQQGDLFCFLWSCRILKVSGAIKEDTASIIPSLVS